jgi:hypothetical protein
MVAVVVCVGTLAACAPTRTPLYAAVAPDTIVITNFAFDPGGIAVAPGTAITVVNRDTVANTLTPVDMALTKLAGPPRIGAMVVDRVPLPSPAGGPGDASSWE